MNKTIIAYGLLGQELIRVLKDRVAAISFADFDKAFNFEGCGKSAKERLFTAVMSSLSITPVEEGDRRKADPRYILDPKLRGDLARRLTAEKVEYICLNAEVFKSRGRANKALTKSRLARLAELKAAAKPIEEKEESPVLVYNDVTGDFEIPQMSDEDQLVILEAQIAQLQKEADAKRAEIEARKAAEAARQARLRLKSDILEMFEITEAELLEILNTK